MATLTDIDAAFDALSEEHKLLLIDHLRDRAGFDLDTRAAALDLALSRYRDEDRAAEYADSLVPQGICIGDTWTRHAAVRDRTLEYALTYKPAFGAAA